MNHAREEVDEGLVCSLQSRRFDLDVFDAQFLDRRIQLCVSVSCRNCPDVSAARGDRVPTSPCDLVGIAIPQPDNHGTCFPTGSFIKCLQRFNVVGWYAITEQRGSIEYENARQLAERRGREQTPSHIQVADHL